MIWTMGEMIVEIMRDKVDAPLYEAEVFRGPYPSGAPAIFIDTAARLGQETGIISGVGCDDFGKCLLDRLNAHGVDTSLVLQDPSCSTGCAFVTYFSDGERKFIFHIGNTPAAKAKAPAQARKSDFFHVMGCSLMADDKFGEEIVKNEEIYIHDCDEKEKLVNVGTLPSGGDCEINSIAIESDLLVAEGFIEPHFFAGFSGGRKSVLPGIAGRSTVLANHCSEFINHNNARTGILEGNPIHEDMLWAAQKAKLQFIVNVVLNAEKEIIYAVAGDMEKAHKKGTEFLSTQCGAKAVYSDIAISTNGGFPLDQNVYQAVKGMTAAEATVRKGGVIIMIASSSDGIGGDHFYHQLADEADISKTMDIFLKRSRNETVPDQWQTQIMLRVLMRAKVIYISEMEDDVVEKMHMIPAHSIDEAIKKAKEILEKTSVTITAIPDGVSVVVHQ